MNKLHRMIACLSLFLQKYSIFDTLKDMLNLMCEWNVTQLYLMWAVG